jgi:hypothetical protein
LHDFPHCPQFRGSLAKVASQPLAAFASQLPKPALHVNPQASAVHVAAALAGTGQTVQAAPHAVGSVGAVHLPAQALFGGVHFSPQVSLTHVAAPPAGTGHGVQSGPQAVGSVLARHLPPHAWKLALQVNVHAPAVQALVELATTGHLMLQPPQWFVLVTGSTHSAPQFRGAPGVQPFVHWNVGPEGAHSGEAAPQTALQAPQLAAFERSVSHPSPGVALQSEYPGSH